MNFPAASLKGGQAQGEVSNAWSSFCWVVWIATETCLCPQRHHKLMEDGERGNTGIESRCDLSVAKLWPVRRKAGSRAYILKLQVPSPYSFLSLWHIYIPLGDRPVVCIHIFIPQISEIIWSQSRLRESCPGAGSRVTPFKRYLSQAGEFAQIQPHMNVVVPLAQLWAMSEGALGYLTVMGLQQSRGLHCLVWTGHLRANHFLEKVQEWEVLLEVFTWTKLKS